MKLFLVRVAGKPIVQGIFWAHTPAGLRRAVQEMTDPHLFEWTEMTRLGGVWREEAAEETFAIPDCRDFPLSPKGEEAFGQAFDTAFAFGFSGFGERLVKMMASQEDHVWTRFDGANVGLRTAAQAIRRVGKVRQSASGKRTD
jgi:hypothetical protein